MTGYGVRCVGPSALTLRVATALADASGRRADLVGSSPHVADGNVALSFAVEGASDAVADAVATICSDMPSGTSIEITDTT